jgi:arginyl-tRNA synthetase
MSATAARRRDRRLHRPAAGKPPAGRCTREFYYNDAGAQITTWRCRCRRARGRGPEDQGWPADGYRGHYIGDVAAAYLAGRHGAGRGPPKSLPRATRTTSTRSGEFAVAYLRREQDLDLQGLRRALRRLLPGIVAVRGRQGRGDRERLVAHGHTYEEGGALWLRTTDFGDDKDRVMRKSDGSYTYFVPDVAYHLSKWQRGYRARSTSRAPTTTAP